MIWACIGFAVFFLVQHDPVAALSALCFAMANLDLGRAKRFAKTQRHCEGHSPGGCARCRLVD